MKILIVTIAGISSRFSESLGYDCLKCLYYENSFEESLLYRMLHQNEHFDLYVLVGGFQYEKLEAAVKKHIYADIRNTRITPCARAWRKTGKTP